MTAWEYRVEELNPVQMANQLNFIGSEGWELVYIHYQENNPYPYICIFKRQKEEGLF